MKHRKSGFFYVACDVANICNRKRVVTVRRMLVDTTEERTWVLEPVLRELGIPPVKMEALVQVDGGELVTRSIGFAWLRCGEFETVDELVFAQPGDVPVLGARTLGGFWARPDPRIGRLVSKGPRPAACVPAWCPELVGP